MPPMFRLAIPTRSYSQQPYLYHNSIERLASHGHASDVAYFLKKDPSLHSDRIFIKNLMLSSMSNPFIFREVLPYTSQHERDDFAYVIGLTSRSVHAHSVKLFSASLSTYGIEEMEKGLNDKKKLL